MLRYLLLCQLLAASLMAGPVRLDGERMLHNGEPYFIKGVGGAGSMEELARRGGNSVRTWTTNKLGDILDEAARHQLTVCAGIWLEPECSWFSYANPEHCERQSTRVREEVMQWRSHPALLLWGLGNEIDGDGKNIALWQQINRLARLVHEIDPDHPSCLSVAGFSAERAAGLKDHCPDLDIVGINTYGALPGLRAHLKKIGWTRPWIVTEYGTRGFWEIKKSPWGAPLEPSSSEKAAFIRMAYQAAIAPSDGCLGSYAFLWGQKQEATSTWFGLLMEDGATTAAVDVLQELWSGKTPTNFAPKLITLTSSTANTVIKPGTIFTATAAASDVENDPLTYRWSVTKESAGRDEKGRENPTLPLDGCVILNGKAEAEVRTPHEPGSYRLHVRADDGHHHAATANVPFRVEP